MASLGRMSSVLIVVGVFTAACGSGTGAATTTGEAPRLPGATVSVQPGFAGNETFCAGSPLMGTIRYKVAHGDVQLQLGVDGLPAVSTVVVNWLNNPTRGYAIGAFSTDSAGSSLNSSAHLYRPGETRGYEIQLASSDAMGTVLGVMRPCG